MRDLRNHGGDIVDRVQRGEHLTVTRSGRPVAQLVPVRRPALKATVLLDRWRGLPAVEPEALRRDLASAVDASL
ncbi:MAG: type II toxin-antitoxin system prevent-host-death family antitoxin [Actinobacteria bacterium]|nr:type II toxin-antitoxin system prevent-host-death family antitoxin [Actinomycetota bacterium]